MSQDTELAGAFIKRHRGALLGSLALTVMLALLLNHSALPLWPPKGALAKVNWWKWALMTLLLLINTAGRFIRYVFLIRPIARISTRRLMIISAIALGLITFLPFRLGEFARPAMLREKGKLSGWAVTGTVGAERVIDGVLFSAMLLLGLAFAKPHEPIPDHIGDLTVSASQVPRVAFFMALTFGLAFLVMLGFFLWRSTARRLTESVIGMVSRPLALKVADAVERLSDGLKFLPNLRYTIPYVLLTVLSLFAHLLSLQQLVLAAGLPGLTLSQAAVCVGVLALAFALPNAPGFFGTIQLALYAGMATYFEPAKVVHEGATVVFLFYVTYLALVISIFVIGLLLEYAGAGAEPAELRAPESP
jgi:hypothetical protein